MFLSKTQFPCNPLSFQIWTSIHRNIFNLSIIHLLMWWLNSCNIKFHLQGSYHQIMVSVAFIFWNSKEQKLIHLICGIHTSKASDHSVENLYYYCAYLNKKMKMFSVFVYTHDACSLFKLTFFSSSLTEAWEDIVKIDLLVHVHVLSIFFIVSYDLKHFLQLREKIS